MGFDEDQFIAADEKRRISTIATHEFFGMAMENGLGMLEARGELIDTGDFVEENPAILVGDGGGSPDDIGKILAGFGERVNPVGCGHVAVEEPNADIVFEPFCFDQGAFQSFAMAVVENHFVTGLTKVVARHHDVFAGDESRGHFLIKGHAGHVEIPGPSGHHDGIFFVRV